MTDVVVANPDPKVTEQQCVELRRDLVRYMRWQHHPNPEDGAQDAWLRGWAKGGAQALEGDYNALRSYFFGFAWFVAREAWRPRKEGPLDEKLQVPDSQRAERRLEARVLVGQLLGQLEPAERRLVVRYHSEDRQALSRRLGIPNSTVRVQVHRICAKLQRMAAARRLAYC